MDAQPKTESSTGHRLGLLRRHQAVLGSLAALLAIFSTLIGVARWAFSAPDVAITVRQTQLSLPDNLAGDFDLAVGDIRNKSLPDSLRVAAHRLEDFIRGTRNFTVITVTNNSERSVQNVDVRVTDASQVTGWSLGGTYLTSSDRAKIVSGMSYDPNTSLLVVPTLPRLSPHSQLNLYVWGDVQLNLLSEIEGPVSVTFDGGSGQVVRSTEVHGLDAFVYENAGLLVLVLMAINLAVLTPLLSRKPSASTPPAASV